MNEYENKLKVRISGVNSTPEICSDYMNKLKEYNENIFVSCKDIYDDSDCDNMLIIESIQLDATAKCRSIIDRYIIHREGAIAYPTDKESIEPYITSVTTEIRNYAIDSVMRNIKKESIANIRKENINNFNRICFSNSYNYEITTVLKDTLFRYIDFLYNLVNSKSN